jgi:hypothetical protein
MWGFQNGMVRLSAVVHELRKVMNIADEWITYTASGKKFKRYFIDYKRLRETRMKREDFATNVAYYEHLLPCNVAFLETIYGAEFNMETTFKNGRYEVRIHGYTLTDVNVRALFMKYVLVILGIKF